ncbi:MAG: family N-acetyltransferase [Segetibacter sp.]|jgi:ribosomal protein S18 acetylase RimI-like enzyme|nr:family N-acetyltransferase [Segetibacter sp.]
MIKAGKIHKQVAIDILSECFESNKTVNYIIKQDSRRKERIRDLIDYSFDACINCGQTYFTDDFSGVIICSMSDDKLPILEEALLTAQFVLKVTGIEGIGKALKREQYIQQFHPDESEFLYIWFIGLKKTEQGKGVGSQLLQEIINKSNEQKVPVYVETSSERILNFYKKFGFEVYHVADEEVFGYKLYFLRRFPDTNT